MISLEILEAGFLGSSLIHEVLPSSELKVFMLCMFFNAVDSGRAVVGVIFKILSPESNDWVSLSEPCISISSV